MPNLSQSLLGQCLTSRSKRMPQLQNSALFAKVYSIPPLLSLREQ